MGKKREKGGKKVEELFESSALNLTETSLDLCALYLFSAKTYITQHALHVGMYNNGFL